MPGGELEPVARTASALAEVASELTEIFARAGVSQPTQGARRPAAVAALRPGRSGGPTVTVLVAVVAGLAGLGAGAFVIRTPTAQSQADARPAARAPAADASAPSRLAPQAGPPVALAQASPTIEAPPVSGEAGVKASPAPAKAAPAARTKPRARARAGARAASAKATIRLPTPVAQPASCEDDASSDDCRRAVIQADRHLRAVYEGAIRRGVSRSTLVDYRDRWSDLRERETDNPTRLIESYGALAYDLGREHADLDDQEDASRPRGRSGLRALADLLLPWR